MVLIKVCSVLRKLLFHALMLYLGKYLLFLGIFKRDRLIHNYASGKRMENLQYFPDILFRYKCIASIILRNPSSSD